MNIEEAMMSVRLWNPGASIPSVYIDAPSGAVANVFPQVVSVREETAVVRFSVDTYFLNASHEDITFVRDVLAAGTPTLKACFEVLFCL